MTPGVSIDTIELRDGDGPEGGEPAITVALRKSLGEITVQDLHARDDPGYDGLCEGHDLYEAAWFSAHVGRKMYLKFSLFDGRLTIVSFHESTKDLNS